MIRNSQTVLLVEDDPDIRDVVQEYLEEQGRDVVPAATGKQALDFLLSTGQPTPGVVILDLLLPLITGWQVLERMRADPRLAGVPVVVLTTMTSDRPPGASAVLQKPFGLDALDDALRRVSPV